MKKYLRWQCIPARPVRLALNVQPEQKCFIVRLRRMLKITFADYLLTANQVATAGLLLSRNLLMIALPSRLLLQTRVGSGFLIHFKQLIIG